MRRAEQAKAREAARIRETANRRIVGAAVVLALFVLLILIALRPNPFKHTQQILVRFDSAQGLGSIDRNVRAAGVNVGTIGKVERVGDDALMELDINPDIPIHSDALAALRPHTLFEGSDFVDLQPGSPSAPLLDGNTIPRSQTRVYVSLDQATRVLRTSNREALRDLIHSGAKLVEGSTVSSLRRVLKASPELVKELGPTTRALRGPRGDELAGAIQGMSQTVHAVASRQADLAPLVRRTNHTVSALEVDAGAPLDRAIRALPGPLRQLSDGGPDLVKLVDEVDAFAVSLRPVVKVLPAALRETRPVMRAATPVTLAAVPVVAQLRVILTRLAAASPALEQLVSTTTPGARLLGRSVVPYLQSRSRLGLPIDLQLISAFTGATGAQRPYQSKTQNPNGAGHLLRLGSYFDPNGTVNGLAFPSCAAIAVLNPALATALQTAGLCST